MIDHNNIPWNLYIVPRLERLLAWFKQDEFTEGLRPYLEEMRKVAQRKLNDTCANPRHEDVLRGVLQEIDAMLEFPSVLERNIEIAQSKNNRAKPAGAAGY